MTFNKRRNRATRYARNKERDNTKTIINDSMYIIGVDPYSLEEEGKCSVSMAEIIGNPDGTITTRYFSKSKEVLPVIKDKRVTLLQKIKNFINNIIK